MLMLGFQLGGDHRIGLGKFLLSGFGSDSGLLLPGSDFSQLCGGLRIGLSLGNKFGSVLSRPFVFMIDPGLERLGSFRICLSLLNEFSPAGPWRR